MFCVYYMPLLVNDGPAGTYVALKIDEATDKFAPMWDFVKYPRTVEQSETVV
jgi:hypothetical protein